jgi:hypothetical protein
MDKNNTEGPKLGVRIPGIQGVTFLFICDSPNAVVLANWEKQCEQE